MYEDLPAFYAGDYGRVRGQHYDIVLNGVEIGGGSVRIHDPEMQEYVFRNALQVSYAPNNLLFPFHHHPPRFRPWNAEAFRTPMRMGVTEVSITSGHRANVFREGLMPLMLRFAPSPSSQLSVSSRALYLEAPRLRCSLSSV